jgi:hypothetical protein
MISLVNTQYIDRKLKKTRPIDRSYDVVVVIKNGDTFSHIFNKCSWKRILIIKKYRGPSFHSVFY